MNKIFSFVKITEGTRIASTNIAKFISRVLEIPHCHDESVDADGPLETLIIVGGAFGFAGSDILEHLALAIGQARDVIWVQNDYTVIPPKDDSGAVSPFRAAFRERYQRTGQPSVSFWTTCEFMAKPGLSSSGHRCGARSAYVNWNALAMDDREVVPWAERSRKDSMIYYGSYRVGASPGAAASREKYFDRYFTEPAMKSVISSPSDKFGERYDKVHHEPKQLDLGAYLRDFGLGLYIEDKKSHDEFHSPANRFYEMLSAGLPMVFQPEARKMLMRAGYDIDDYLAWNSLEVAEFGRKAQEVGLSQHGRWYERAWMECRSLESRLKELWCAG
jgi:hypothetical protein